MSHSVVSDRDYETYRQKRERYVYVIEFRSGTVKVGQTGDASRRLAEHIKSATIHCDKVTRSWFSEPHLDYRENEGRLLDYCMERWPPVVGEFFGDADFDEIVGHAQGLPFRRLTEAQIVQAILTSQQHGEAARAELQDRMEVRRLLGIAEAAVERIDLISSLANDANRWAASEATYEIVKHVISQEPAAWSTKDPTAAERYLASYGAALDVAQRTAPEFELTMRTLYALSNGREADSFDDIARFCAPYMSRGSR